MERGCCGRLLIHCCPWASHAGQPLPRDPPVGKSSVLCRFGLVCVCQQFNIVQISKKSASVQVVALVMDRSVAQVVAVYGTLKACKAELVKKCEEGSKYVQCN